MAKREKSYTEALSELQNILDKIESVDLDVDVLTESNCVKTNCIKQMRRLKK